MIETPLPVTIFADFTSPYCYYTEWALESLARRHPLELRPKAFELHPVPAPLPDPSLDLADLEMLAPLVRAAGLELRAPAARPRTRKAHEAAVAAAARGVGGPMRQAIYEAYWRDSRDIGRIDVLLELGEGVGIDPMDLKIALDIDREHDAVRADLELARRLRVTAVPTLFIGVGADATILVGAQSLAALDEALTRG